MVGGRGRGVGAWSRGAGRPAFLALLVLDPEGPPAGRPRGGARRPRDAAPRGHRSSRPAGLRPRGRARRSSRRCRSARRLPAWRLALYRPAGVSPRAAVRPPGHAVHGRLRAPPGGDRRRPGRDLPAGPARDRDGAAQGGVRRQRLARPQDPALPDPGVRGDPRDGTRERRGDAPRVLPGDHPGERAPVAAHRERARLLAHRGRPPHLRPCAGERGAARAGHRRELRVRAGPAGIQGGRGDPARTCPRCRWTPTRWARPSGT